MYFSAKFKHLDRKTYVIENKFDIRSYLVDLITKAKDPELWPRPDHTETVKALLARANQAARSESVSENISAIFIYHQLLTQALIFLADNAAFYQQILSFPRPVFPIDIQKKTSLSKAIGSISQTIWFQNKECAIAEAKKVNEIRNRLAHELPAKFNSENVHTDTGRVAEIMGLFMFISLEGYGDIRDQLMKYLTDPDWPDHELEITDDGGRILGKLGELI